MTLKSSKHLCCTVRSYCYPSKQVGCKPAIVRGLLAAWASWVFTAAEVLINSTTEMLLRSNFVEHRR